MVLEKIGAPRKFKYRFANPLLRPFIVLKWLADPELKDLILQFLMEDDEDEELIEQEKNGQGTLFD